MKMLRSKWKINIKTILLLFITFGMSFMNLNLFLFNSNSFHNFINTIENDQEDNVNNFEDQIPKTSEYQVFSENGEQMDVSLHQSLLNTSIKEFTNLDNSYSFSEAAPEFNNFNSTFMNITVNGITAPNKSITIEDVFSGRWALSSKIWTSFEVRGTCLLKNISVQVRNNGGLERYFINVWNATLSGSYIKYDTDLDGLSDIATIDQADTGTNNIWINTTDVDFNLDASNTYNNTFFVSVSRSQTFGEWVYENEGNGDDTITWDDGEVTPYDRDQNLKVSFAPLSNTPKPSEIGLKINGSTISDDIGGGNKGYWSNTNEYQGLNGKLDFSISAEYWDASCNITNALINYTKTDLKANSNFDIFDSGQDVQWNLTVPGGLNYFDSRIDEFTTINYTIPEIWDDATIRVFNDTTEKTDLIKKVLGNGYRDVQVLDAGNGTNWYLTANSTNLISSIDTYVSGVLLIPPIANFTNILRFNASFIEIVSNGNLNLSIFSPIPRYLNHTTIIGISSSGTEFLVSDWDISLNATDYGVFKAQMSWNNNTAAGFLELLFTIVADTNLVIIEPESGENHYDNELFDIVVFYNDTGPNLGDIGIANATITEDSGLLVGPTTNGTDGYYFLQLDTDLFSYGWNYIEINTLKTYYNNRSVTFSFHYRRNTTISPSNTKDFNDVIRGTTVSYTFNYSDNSGGSVLGASIDNVTLPPEFAFNDIEVGNGNYTIELITSNVDASPIPYTCIFNITLTGYETQEIYLTLTIVQAQTSVTILTPSNTVLRKDGFDQTLEFFFNDTDNDIGIPSVALSDINVRDNQTGLLRSINTLTTNGTDGYYNLNVSISGLDSGWIQFTLNVSRDPDYNWSIDYFTFYLRGNLTQTSLESLSDPGGEEILTIIGFNYSIFTGRNVNVNFTITDDDYNDNLVTGDANSYLIDYYEIGNPINQGTLSHSLDFDANTDSYKGYLISSGLTASMTYAINITASITNYETSLLSFNLTVKPKININISVIDKPTEVTAGDTFNITLKAEFYNGSGWEPLVGIDMTIIPSFDGVNASATAPIATNINGTVTFEITIGREAESMILYAKIDPAYNITGAIRQIPDISVNPLPSGLEELIPFLIIGGIIIGAVAASVGIYRGAVVPKKREKQRILSEVKTIFDDAINLEHILVLYKGTGTCIFFKSYGSEQIDPELISGFLSAVSSFGKEMVAQEALNEISYGDKMLLLADGTNIRVALVLGKKASLILRRHLKEFIDSFEKIYRDVLPNWRGQLAYFRNAGQLVDDILNTSIILPHQISYDFSNVKELKNPHSKDVLKIAHTCCDEADRQFFFIATLLQEAADSTNKDTAEIFMGVKELRDKRILLPIEISAIEAQPISQQELNLINQKVLQLTNLTPEEQQKLVNDLAQMGPTQREAYLSSLAGQREIVSAPIKSMVGTAVIEDKKSAKKELQKLMKESKKAKNEKDYLKSIEFLQNAALIASNWDLSNEFIKLEDVIRETKIEDLMIKKKNFENKAKIAVKQKIYAEAAIKYKEASKMASEIFKLGSTTMTKEVKRLTNKANEFEKLS